LKTKILYFFLIFVILSSVSCKREMDLPETEYRIRLQFEETWFWLALGKYFEVATDLEKGKFSRPQKLEKLPLINTKIGGVEANRIGEG